jgi:cell division protein FtsI (penicillin-binding protein 3)
LPEGWRPGPVPVRAAPPRPGYRRMPPPPVRPALTCVPPGRRLNLTLIVIAFVMSVFAGRLVQLQGLESAKLTADANQQRGKEISIPAVRGSITTSNGVVLAMTIETYTIVADPQRIPASRDSKVAGDLAGPLAVPATSVLAELRHPSSPEYQVLGTGVSQATASHIASLDLPGITMTVSYSRAYPNGDLAADIVGFARPDSQGNLAGDAGLESEYNSLLTGRDGSEYVELGTDGEQIPLTEAKVTQAVPARSLRLTINSDIQYWALQVCRERVLKYHARNCSIVVMQPHTGAILAMAQWPTYDPSDITNVDTTANISTGSVFAPGSTLKPITVAAALEKGGQTPMSAYTIPDQVRIDNEFTFRDAEPHPTVRYTVAGILAHSSNVGMVQVVQHVTPMQQYDYLRAFGLGSPSGLGMPAESAGLLPRPGTPGYYGDDPFEFSFGQGVGVTAIQMASVYATIANGGVRVQPTLVAGTTSAAGAYTAAPRPAGRRVIQAKTARELMTILQQVPEVDAQAGEPWGLILGYTVAAKTGTAQVSDPSKSKCALCQYGSSYIGIAPASNPQLVVAVNVQDPQGKNFFGDEVAGPAFYDVMRFALQTMKIPPDYARTPYIRLMAP